MPNLEFLSWPIGQNEALSCFSRAMAPWLCCQAPHMVKMGKTSENESKPVSITPLHRAYGSCPVRVPALTSLSDRLSPGSVSELSFFFFSKLLWS